MKNFTISDRIINRDTSVELFLSDIKKYQLLTPEDEKKILKLAQNGDQKAIDLLITTNLRFVVSVAKEYVTGFHTISDLINVGTIGLIKSINRFDIASGNRFLSFGVWGIRGEIFEYINKETLISVPYNKTTAKIMVQNIVIKYVSEHGELPTHKYISKATNGKVKVKDVETILKISNWSTESIDDENLTTVEKFFSTDTVASKDDDDYSRHQIETLFSKITEREQFVINNHFGLNGFNKITLEEIGNKLGLTREGVRKIQIRALNKLKELV